MARTFRHDPDEMDLTPHTVEARRRAAKARRTQRHQRDEAAFDLPLPARIGTLQTSERGVRFTPVRGLR